MEAMEFVAPWDKTEAEAEEVSLRLLDIEVTGLCWNEKYTDLFGKRIAKYEKEKK